MSISHWQLPVLRDSINYSARLVSEPLWTDSAAEPWSQQTRDGEAKFTVGPTS